MHKYNNQLMDLICTEIHDYTTHILTLDITEFKHGKGEQRDFWW